MGGRLQERLGLGRRVLLRRGPKANLDGLPTAPARIPSMHRRAFHYELPETLIAQTPLAERAASRLLHLGRDGRLRDRMFAELPGLLSPGDHLVFNDTRVIPARLLGQKASGGRVEVLVERLLEHPRVLAQTRASKTPKAGSKLILERGLEVEVIGRRGDLFELAFPPEQPVLTWLEHFGHVPLPPYITRPDRPQDRGRYQTVYAREPGAVAAPTAGLHFDDPMLDRLAAEGVERSFITLHVGAGTFQPLRTEDPTRHSLHPEYIRVDSAVCDALERTRRRGGRIVAVGTTVVRALETAGQDGVLSPYTGDTSLYILPGFTFRVVDRLITNFHLPESTLLMLVCAFGGYEPVMAAYRHAVTQGYRFYSYGDAMLVERR